MARMSIATIDSPEFINVKPYNPLISECEIKVMYVGENRNHSYISKQVATEMANTLPGCPIVGYFRKEAQDFGDHGQRMIIENGEIKFECMTRPYGFISPNAKVWFQKFREKDSKGAEVIREYLMTTGFLWTGQYPECRSAATENGKPHSMELDEKTLNGEWSQEINKDIEFFIINDGIFSKLCILGDDVEPCFEGSSITAPKVSSSFTKMDEDFKVTLFTMMKELKDALQEGGNQMTENMENVQVETPVVENIETPVVEEPTAEVVETPGFENNNSEFSQDNSEKEDDKKNEDSVEDEKKEEEKPDEYAQDKDEDDKDDKSEEPESKDEDDKDDEEDKKSQYSLEEIPEYVELSQRYLDLETRFNALENEIVSLREFKLEKDNEAKDALIKTFCMLSEDDIREVVENKAKYTLDEIEAKLAVIAVRKKVNFSLEENETKEDNGAITTFNLNDEQESVPAWIKAVRKTAQNR